MSDPTRSTGTDVLHGDQDTLVLVATATNGQVVVMKLEARLLEYSEVPLRVHLVGVVKSLVVVQSSEEPAQAPSAFN